jgi:hypothetical protein
MATQDPTTPGGSSTRFLGVVEVDSGRLLLVDPIYDEAVGQAVAVMDDAPATSIGGVGLLLAAFGGDGTYPAFGTFDEDGVLERVVIEFLAPELDEEMG